MDNQTKEQLDKLKPMLARCMPELAQLANIYTKRYPLASTAPEVIDAVTVSISLRSFLVFGAAASVIAADLFKEGENANG